MNKRDNQEIEQRLNKYKNLTIYQIIELEKRIKKHRETHGQLNEQSLLGKLRSLFN